MNPVTALRSTTEGTWGILGSGGSLLRVAPEPRNSAPSWRQSLTDTASQLASIASSLVGGPLRATSAGLIQKAAASSARDPELDDLIQQQMRFQYQMQLYSAQSNIERSKHETVMTPLRNMRLG